MELGAFVLSWPLLRYRLPKGDGHPVLILPGFMTGDTFTLPLRYLLESLNYAPHRWRLGANFGPSPSIGKRLYMRVKDLRHRYGKKVSIVGWSLGGIYAREIARELPNHVRQVITLGSPFADISSNNTNIGWLFETVSGQRIPDLDPALVERLNQPLPVPMTAIYSHRDGIAAWQSCMEKQAGPLAENVRVNSSHCGMGHNPLVMRCIADRLAQAEGAWRPFHQ
ncbi:MAG: alpha/beta hydrolase [Pseudomonadota bacterium]